MYVRISLYILYLLHSVTQHVHNIVNTCTTSDMCRCMYMCMSVCDIRTYAVILAADEEWYSPKRPSSTVAIQHCSEAQYRGESPFFRLSFYVVIVHVRTYLDNQVLTS